MFSLSSFTFVLLMEWSCSNETIRFQSNRLDWCFVRLMNHEWWLLSIFAPSGSFKSYVILLQRRIKVEKDFLIHCFRFIGETSTLESRTITFISIMFPINFNLKSFKVSQKGHKFHLLKTKAFEKKRWIFHFSFTRHHERFSSSWCSWDHSSSQFWYLWWE